MASRVCEKRKGKHHEVGKHRRLVGAHAGSTHLYESLTTEVIDVRSLLQYNTALATDTCQYKGFAVLCRHVVWIA